MRAEQCDARAPDDERFVCFLRKGHEGRHSSAIAGEGPPSFTAAEHAEYDRYRAEEQSMTGHALLPECQVPWRHDGCPGIRRHANAVGESPLVGSGLVCHCACHAARREVTRLRIVLATLINNWNDPEGDVVDAFDKARALLGGEPGEPVAIEETQ